MRTRHLIVALALAGVALDTEALPSFARREGLGCNVCHTSIPRLSRFGYDYRNSGYRLPPTLGETDKEWRFGDFNSAAAALTGAQAVFEYQYGEERTALSTTRSTTQVRLRLAYVF